MPSARGADPNGDGRRDLSRRQLAAGALGLGAALATGGVVSEARNDPALAAGPPTRGRLPDQAIQASLSGGSANGTTGLLLLQPPDDTTDGIIIVEPDSTYGDRGGQPYGEGQPIILYKEGSGTPQNQVLFRVDAYGGIGTADGIHVEPGLNQDAGYSGPYGMFIQLATHDTTGLIIGMHQNPSSSAFQVENSSGQPLVVVDHSGRLLLSAPDSVAREIGVKDEGGTVRAALYSGRGNYGARTIFSSGSDDVTPTLIIGSGGSQTKDLVDVMNSGTTWLKVTSGGQLVAAGDASVAGTGHKLGFYGAPQVAQPPAPTTVVNTGATNIAPYGYTTAQQANAVVVAVNALINALSQTKGGCGITA